MIYTASIKTLSGKDAETVLGVTSGLVWRIEVDFPAGCCGLMSVQIFDGSYQLFPASPGEIMHGDGVVLSYDDLYLKDAAPFEFKIKTRNDDELWDHTIQVRIGLASQRVYMSRYMPSVSWEDFERLMAKVSAEQERMKEEQVRILTEKIVEE